MEVSGRVLYVEGEECTFYLDTGVKVQVYSKYKNGKWITDFTTEPYRLLHSIAPATTGDLKLNFKWEGIDESNNSR